MEVHINRELCKYWLIRSHWCMLKSLSEMAALKFTGFIFLVYFAIFANAGKRFCKRADQKLADLKTLIENLDCSGQGTIHCDLSSFCLLFVGFIFLIFHCSISLAIDYSFHVL